jgi:hypothetical protein
MGQNSRKPAGKEDQMRKSPAQLAFRLCLAVLACGVLAVGAMASQTSKAKTSGAQTASSTTAKAKVDLNKATEKELDSLPGVGSATAKKIIAGRPYSSVDDLSKAGIPATTIKKIAPLVTVSGATAAVPGTETKAKGVAPVAQPTSAAPSQTASTPTAPAARPSTPGTPGPGTVWVNLDSGVYHYPGTRYYGKTKNGKYMSEADAVKAGYRAAKDEKKPQ